MSISAALRAQIQAQAGYRCEYCKTSSRLVGMPLVIDHIQPQAEGGSDHPNNLAAACYRCNEFKGAKTFEVDPATTQLAALSNPRSSTGQTILLGLMVVLILRGKPKVAERQSLRFGSIMIKLSQPALFGLQLAGIHQVKAL